MNPQNYLFLSALLFTIGAAGVLLRRNAIVVFMCIELMLNAVNLAFVTWNNDAFWDPVIRGAEDACPMGALSLQSRDGN